MKNLRLKDLFKTLLHIEDTPERTAVAYAVGVFLGFSPFLGLHTLSGLGAAFLFRLNRVAVLLGVWSNTPWWLAPYYFAATWVGMRLTGFHLESTALKEILQLGFDRGFLGREFWESIASQKGFLISFGLGSTVLSLFLTVAAYFLSLKWIRFYRARKR